MVDPIHYRHPQEVAARLEVSAFTLHQWTEQFADFLSQEAHSNDAGHPRRYTDEDLATLIMVKGLLSEGLSHDEVRQRLNELRAATQPSEAQAAPDQPQTPAAGPPALPIAPAIAFISDTLHNVATSQQAVLNSQAANRELLGVVLQDNFNLKEENARLRERMLELERQMAQLGREQEARREALRTELEARIQDLQRMVMLQSRSGCLGGLFGIGR
ncbi:MAG: MerR family transcriptional regulator [Anaerolineae bacterium]